MDRARGGAAGGGGSASSSSNSAGAAAGAPSRRRTLPPSAALSSSSAPASSHHIFTHSRADMPNFTANSSPASSYSSPARPFNSAPSRGGRMRGGVAPSMARSGDFSDNISPSRTPRSERSAKPSSLSQSFSYSTPSPTMSQRTLMTRKRSQTFEFDGDGNPHDETVSKGGHSLRKRTRIDYSHIEQDADADAQRPDGKNVLASGQRGRKRKPTFSVVDDDSDDAGNHSAKKLRLSRQREVLSPASARRKQPAAPARKTVTDDRVFIDESSDNDVKDTIEVGVTYDDDSEYSEEQSSFNQSESSKSSAEDIPAAEPVSQPLEQSEQPVVAEQPAPSERAVSAAADPTPKVVVDKPVEEPAAVTPAKVSAVEEDKPAQAADKAEPQPQKSPEPTQSSDESHPHVTALNGVLHFTRIRPRSKLISESLRSSTPPNTIHHDVDASPQPIIKQEPTTQNPDLQDERQPTPKEASPKPVTIPSKEPTPALVASPAAVDEAAPEAVVDKAEPKEVPSPVAEAESRPSPQPQSELPSTPSALPATASTEQERSGPEPSPLQSQSTAPAEAAVDTLAADEPLSISEPKQDGVATEEADTSMPDAPSQESPGELRRSSRRRKSTIKMGSKEDEIPSPSNKSAANEQNETARQQSSPELSKKSLAKAANSTTFPGDPFALLSPYVDGQVYFPEIAEDSVAATPSADQNGEAADEAADAAQLDVQDSIEEQLVADQLDGLDGPDDNGGSGIVTPNGDFAAMSPAVEDRQDAATDSAAPGSTPQIALNGIEGTPKPTRSRKQYAFKKLRDPEEFVEALKDYKKMDTNTLFNVLAAVNNTLVTWQDEYNELRKITDDEDNAVRRRQQDLNYENKVNMAFKKNNPDTEVLERDFAIKGVRAKEFIADPGKVRQKQQDKLMSEIYFFEHDPREAMVGKQDPEEQREGLQNTRLRNRPRMTQKAVEAEIDPDATGPGKRTRKKKVLSDESRDASRAGTPAAAAPTRRRRRNAGARGAALAQEEAETDAETIAADDVNGDLPPPVSLTKHGKRRGRPPGTGKAAMAAAAAARAAAEAAQEEQPKTGRGKRKRATKADEGKQVPPVPAYKDEPKNENPELLPQPKKRRIKVLNGNKPDEIASTSFYTQSSADADADDDDESRPSSSGSDGTVDTVESNYSLRPKRRRKFKDDEEQNSTPPQQPKRRRVTNTVKATQQSSQQPTPAEPIQTIAPAARSYGQDMQYHSAPAPMPGTSVYQQYPPPPPPQQHMHLAPAPVGGAVQPGPPKPRPVKFKHHYSNPGHPSGVAPMPTPTSNSLPGSGSSSRVQTPAPPAQHIMLPAGGGASGGPTGENGGEEHKEYTQMTKSEKMSHSMKTRWANGSMQAAVAKRKATLAAKKAAAAQAATVPPAPPTAGTPAPSSAATPAPGSSAGSTPVPMGPAM